MIPTETAATTGTSRLKRWLIDGAKWGAGLALVAWLVSSNADELASVRDRTWRWDLLVAAFCLWLSAMSLTFVRWRVLVRALDFSFPWRDAFRLGFLGSLWSYVGPGAVGGDLVKAWWLAKDQQERRFAAVLTVFLDRVLGVVALLVVGAVALTGPWANPDGAQMRLIARGMQLAAGAGLGAVALLCLPGLASHPWLQAIRSWRVVGPVAGELLDAAHLYQSRRGSLMFALALSVLGHVGMLSAFYLCGLVINSPAEMPGYLSHLQLIPAAELAGVLPLTPGGLGTLEAAVQECYVWLTPPSSPLDASATRANGLLTSLIFRLVSVAATLLGALIAVFLQVPGRDSPLKG